MNKSDLRNFAINARLELLRRVRERAVFYGVDEKSCAAGGFVPSDRFQRPDGAPLSAVEIAQRDALLRRVLERGYAQTMEEAAYTWFNRFAALRYMQAHNRLPISVRVLPDAPGEAPQLLREAQDVELPGADMGRVLDMLSASDSDGLYKYLLIALCNALSESLPGMFEQISDATELLFPDGLLRADSVLGEMAKLDADSWNEIQVVGWLYQYYNTQLKDETFELLRKNVKITRDRIGPATQLFTPEWIVNYMVENSLGRLWLEGHPDANLRMQWRYYMDEAEQAPEVAAKLVEIRRDRSRIQPEQIRVLDPCMGSGHILVYAFDVLMEIYRSVGYTDRDAARSIVENNLYGLDIDDRAAQLAYFAVMMKACEYDRRFLKRGVQPHVCAIQESATLTREQLHTLGTERTLAERLLHCFADAKEYGSILHADFTPEELNRLDARLEEMEEDGGNLLDMADRAAAHAAIATLMEQARILAHKYDAVITNPPYMGASGMNEKLSRFVKDNYPDSKSDLFAVFMERGMEMVKPNGYSSMVTMQSWMFLSSFEKLRAHIIRDKCITTLMHMENMVMGIAFGTAVAVIGDLQITGYKGTYNHIKYEDIINAEPKEFPVSGNRFAQVATENFKKIPGMPVAYWVSERFCSIFDGDSFNDYAQVITGMTIGDNTKYLRLWFEVLEQKIGFNKHSMSEIDFSDVYYIPYSKGGQRRNWYGNYDYIVNWTQNEHFNRAKKTLQHLYLKRAITWPFITSGMFSARILPEGFLWDVAGSPCFFEKKDEEMVALAALCSNSINYILRVMNPTINVQAIDIERLPLYIPDGVIRQEIIKKASDCIEISRKDWDSFEISWDFKKHPLI